MLALTLRQLRAVLAIHRTGKIVSAAKQLGLTQPAVTLQIKEVESILDTQLFVRLAEGMRPTDAGLAVIEAANAIEDRLRGLADEVEAIKGLRRGILRLGVVSTAKYFVPSIIAGFRAEHPGITVALHVGNREEIINSLTGRTIDIAVMGRPPRDVPVRAMAFGDHPLVIIAAAGHPLIARRAMSKETVSREQFLVRERGSGTRSAFEFFFSDVPDRTDHLGTEMGSNETIKQAVMAGLGIAFLSAHTIAQEVALGRIAILDVVGLPVVRQWFAVSRTDHVTTPSMHAFETFLAEKGAGFLPDLSGAIAATRPL